jgi:hypothetical protein
MYYSIKINSVDLTVQQFQNILSSSKLEILHSFQYVNPLNLLDGDVVLRTDVDRDKMLNFITKGLNRVGGSLVAHECDENADGSIGECRLVYFYPPLP